MNAEDIVGILSVAVVVIVVGCLAYGCTEGVRRDSKAACWEKTKREECWK